MDYALILNEEVIKILPDYKAQEGDLLEPHPVKQVPYLVPVEKVEAEAFDDKTQVKEAALPRIEDGKVILETIVREKTEEEIQNLKTLMEKRLTSNAIKYIASQLPQYQDKFKALSALTDPKEILAFDASII